MGPAITKTRSAATIKLLVIAVLLLGLIVPGKTVYAQDEKPAPIADLIEKVKHSEVQVRRDAAYDLHDRGVEAAVAVPALIEALSDGDHQVFFHVVSALALIGPATKDAAPKLVEHLGGNGQK